MAERRSNVNPGSEPEEVTQRPGMDPAGEQAGRYRPAEPRGAGGHDIDVGRTAPAPEAAGRPAAGEKRSAELERDIAHTRAEMSETIDAIQERLSPEHIKQEVKNTVHETIDSVQERFSPENIKHAITTSARDAGRSMLDTIRENPLPSLIAGLSIGWLFMKSREEEPSPYRAGRRYGSYRPGSYGRGYYRAGRPYAESDYYEDYETGTGYARAYESDYETQGRGRSLADRAGDRAQEVRAHAGGVASQVQHRAEEFGHQVQDRVEEFGHQVQDRARQATGSVEHLIYDNPLAAGAIAVGVGALIGAMLPSTQRENELMGGARDRVVHKAEHVAHETMEKVEEVAGRTAVEAKRAVEEVKETAKQEARHVKETAKQGTEEVKDRAKAAANDQT